MEQPFVRVEAFNVERVAAMFEASPRIMLDELLTAMDEVTQQLQGEVADRAPKNYGALAGSIFGEQRLEGEGVLGVVASPLPYAKYVELGTRPHFPPPQKLEDYVRQRFGLTDEEDIKRAAYLVARKIGWYGTPAYGMFNRAFVANKAQVERRFEMAVDRTARRMDALREGAG
jgi:hypothetical protein